MKLMRLADCRRCVLALALGSARPAVAQPPRSR